MMDYNNYTLGKAYINENKGHTSIIKIPEQDQEFLPDEQINCCCDKESKKAPTKEVIKRIVKSIIRAIMITALTYLYGTWFRHSVVDIVRIINSGWDFNKLTSCSTTNDK